MYYGRYRDYVLSNMPKRELLEQLAEEAAELSQAALKLIRADKNCGSTNPTPVSVEEAWDRAEEELGDVLMLADALFISPEHNTMYNPKWRRWAERLGYKEDMTDE